MIPKYFRCGDPSQKCPLSVSKELIREGKGWKCPCANPNCIDFREPVSFADGVTGGRGWILYSGAGALALIILLLFLFRGSDSCNEKLKGFQASLSSIEKKLTALESKPEPQVVPSSGGGTSVRTLTSDTEKLEARVNAALPAGDDSIIGQLRVEADRLVALAKLLSETIGKPDAGSGVHVAEAKNLIGRLQPLAGEVEEHIELTQTKCPKHTGMFDDLRNNVTADLAKARRIASPSAPKTPPDESLMNSIKKCTAKLEAHQSKLAAFVPAAKDPWPRSTADLRIAASSDLAAELVAPLAAAWSDAKVVEGSAGSLFIESGTKGKLLIEACSAEKGFERLASGETALFFADRAPSIAELGRFGSDFKESRSVAEVVALDALTLLVNPEDPTDTFEVGKPVPLKLAIGPLGSAVQQRSVICGLSSSATLDTWGEQAVIKDRNMLAVSLYHLDHLDGPNLKAKRLAVKASREAPALNPSPFTIATEDYLYSYRVVAWTSRKPSDKALAFVKFVTSNPGQDVVKNRGFVDLRLKPPEPPPDPRILAALGEALGVKTISSALRLSTNIRFQVGEAEMDIKAQADLVRLPDYLANNYATHRVVILGFTDSDGGPAINVPLAKKRAAAVAEELSRSKVDTRAGGLGDSFPIDTNATVAGKARNRRAEVWVVKP
jgi:phosphate transport system substrate-binding protein